MLDMVFSPVAKAMWLERTDVSGLCFRVARIAIFPVLPVCEDNFILIAVAIFDLSLDPGFSLARNGQSRHQDPRHQDNRCESRMILLL
jgi:hypothetical protein